MTSLTQSPRLVWTQVDHRRRQRLQAALVATTVIKIQNKTKGDTNTCVITQDTTRTPNGTQKQIRVFLWRWLSFLSSCLLAFATASIFYPKVSQTFTSGPVPNPGGFWSATTLSYRPKNIRPCFMSLFSLEPTIHFTTSLILSCMSLSCYRPQ